MLHAAAVRWAWTLAAAGAAAALAVALLAGGLPDPAEYLGDATDELGRWTYVLVAAVVLLETSVGLGVLSPGEAVLAVAGAAAARPGGLDLAMLLIVVWTFGVVGDTTSYLVGRRHGPRVLSRVFSRLGVTRARLERVGDLYARRGGWVLVGGRFVGPVRVLAPFVAGSSGMPIGKFLRFDVVGIVLWGSAWTLAGYTFSNSIERISSQLGLVGLAVLLLGFCLSRAVSRSAASASG